MGNLSLVQVKILLSFISRLLGLSPELHVSKTKVVEIFGVCTAKASHPLSHHPEGVFIFKSVIGLCSNILSAKERLLLHINCDIANLCMNVSNLEGPCTHCRRQMQVCDIQNLKTAYQFFKGQTKLLESTISMLQLTIFWYWNPTNSKIFWLLHP